jgi:glucosamine-6-phosphate deaminase
VTTTFRVDALEVVVADDANELARLASDAAAIAIREAIRARGQANVMLATGNSQLQFLDRLATDDAASVDWAQVVAFHMDEYVGIAPDHPASFRRYMQLRVASRLPLAAFHYLEGEAPDPVREAARYASLLAQHPLDVCCLGIGENGHLAFNDPPFADFADPAVVKVVELDERSRHQQVGEGHFATLPDVPRRAITVTIPALLRARRVLAVVPEARKAEPVRAALTGPVDPACPASILRRQDHATLFLDHESAGLIEVPAA